MATNQEGRFASFETIAGISGRSYNETFLAACQTEGATETHFNGAVIQWVNIRLSTSYSEINGALNALAIDLGFANWSSVNSIPPLAPGASEQLITEANDNFITEAGDNLVTQG